jgi:hypothetical protein
MISPIAPSLAVAPPRGDMTAVRALLDDALLGLRAIADPGVKLRDAEREIAAALLHTYRALASPGDAAVYHAESANALVRARGALGALQQVATSDRGTEAEMSVMAQAVRLLGQQPPPPDPGPQLPRPGQRSPILRASTGEPQLLDLERSVLYPTIPLPPLPDAEPPEEPFSPPPEATLATDDDIAALLAEAHAAIGLLAAADAEEDEEKDPTEEKPAPKGPLGPPDEAALELEYLGLQLEERDVVLERARTSFEDLGAFAMMRVPQADEGWMSAERVERRLLTRLDSIAACGAWVLPRLVKTLEELPVPDPDMTWAAIFLFASLAGDDALDQALRIARASDVDVDGMLVSVTDAFALAPHPGIEPAMRRWLSDPDPGRRAIAVGALGRRKALVADDAARATVDPDARVVLAGAEALGSALGDVAPQVIEPLLFHATPAVVRAAIASATVRRTRQGVRRAIELTGEARGDFADAALFVAIGGDLDASAALQEDRAASGSDVHIEALGWFGDLDCIDYVLGRMETGTPETQAVAVETLQMLTGAGLTKANAAPEYAPDAQPFTRADTPPEEAALLLVDPAPWAAWWKKHRQHAQPKKRYRFGHLWTPRDSLWQMEHPSSRTRVRRFAHLELVARLGGCIPLDLRAFVVGQQRSLAEWTEYVAARRDRAAPGSWATSYARL